MIIPVIFLNLKKTFAQDYLRRQVRVKIGSIIEQKGTILGLGLGDNSIQYLKRGDSLYDKQTFITRANSQAIILIGYRSVITLGSNTKIRIKDLSNSRLYLLQIFKGSIRYEYNGAGVPDVFISGKTPSQYYSAVQFTAGLSSQGFIFNPVEDLDVYKYKREISKNKKNIQISNEKINFLTLQNNEKPVFFIKDIKSLKKPISLPSKKTNSNTDSDITSIFEGTSDSVTETTDIDSIFSDFEESSTKKNKVDSKEINLGYLRNKFLKNNYGIKLEKILNPKKSKSSITPEIGKNKPFSKEQKKPFWKEIDYNLFLKSTYYGKAPRSDIGNVDPQVFHQDFRLSMANKILINSSESLAINGWLEGSNRKSVYDEDNNFLDLQSSQRNYLYLNELYYTYSTQKFDIQFGKKIIKFGKGIAYSPSDALSAIDATVPTSPVYLGSFIISLDTYFDDWTFSTIFFPLITPNKSPTQNSRWSTLYSDINFELEQEFPTGISPKSKQILLKLEGTKYGTDWLFTFFNGPNSNPVVRNDITVTNNIPKFTLVQEHIPITFLSIGFSTTYGGFEIHGELLNQNAEDGKDDSFTALMIGTRKVIDTWPRHLGLNSIDIVVEHGREYLRSAQSQPFYALSSIGSRFYQNSWVGTFIFNVTNKFSLNYDYHFDFKNDGVANIFGMNYSSSDTQWRFKIENYSGSQNSNFGVWTNNDNMSLEYLINF